MRPRKYGTGKIKIAFKVFTSQRILPNMALFIVTDFLTIVKKGDGKLNKKKRQASFKKLDTLIKARNVSFYKLSEELGMARSTFSDWKSGKSMPKTDKLIKIANYFGVEVSYFIEQRERKRNVKNRNQTG